MTVMLVDADSIFFKIAYRPASKYKLRQEFDKFCREMELEVKNHVHNLFSEDEFVVKYAVKGKGNFRKDVYPEYKANRKELDPEIRERLNYLYQHSIDKWNAVPADGMEADDLVCIWAYEAREKEEQYVICGIDKDLKQIPGNHFNYGKRTWDFVDDDKADLCLMLQALTGDGTDNIPGITGVGPKKAEKILSGKPYGKRWARVKAAWRQSQAGDPNVSLRLLKMITTWEELKDVQKEIESKASISK